MILVACFTVALLLHSIVTSRITKSRSQQVELCPTSATLTGIPPLSCYHLLFLALALMAEYPTSSEAPLNSKKRARTASDALISTPSLLQTELKRTSKRLRTNSSNTPDKHEIQDIPVPEVVVFERRRVNPESLALRLGPELVRDLDALIKPGNRDMPSFAVRKELQERYDIDRRHIYDYYHSKGLRVVKEDKNGNPIRPSVQSMIVPQVTVII